MVLDDKELETGDRGLERKENTRGSCHWKPQRKEKGGIQTALSLNLRG
jgi:hypothetical protein